MKTKPEEKRLTAELKRVQDLTDEEILSCYELMRDNYNGLPKEAYINELKESYFFTLLFFDVHNNIQGFTEFGIDMTDPTGQNYGCIYSGNTILNPEFWGSQTFMIKSAEVIGRIAGAYPEKKWVWLLLSSGHRTYMFLPLFSQRFFPARQPERNADDLKGLLDVYAEKIFGEFWLPELGIVRFEKGSHYEPYKMKPEIAQATWDKKFKPDIAFYIEKNPEFHNGDQLVCITEVHESNAKKRVLPIYQNGFNQPLDRFMGD